MAPLVPFPFFLTDVDQGNDAKGSYGGARAVPVGHYFSPG